MLNLKRDNWTNEEIIDILNDIKFVKGKDEERNQEMEPWNMALDIAITQFWDFLRPTDEFGAMAYDTTTKEIFVVGPPLPR